MRYADDFVVLSRYPGKRLYGWIESKLEEWLKLVINRDKTRVINLGKEGAFSGLSGLHILLVPRPVWPR